MKGEILFRPAALAALQTPEQLGGSLRAVRPAALLALAVLGLVFAVLLAASFVVTVPIQVRSDAILISSKGMLELSITAQQEGRAVEILVGPRDRVAPGDVVARIEQPQLRLELAHVHGGCRQRQAQDRHPLPRAGRCGDAGRFDCAAGHGRSDHELGRGIKYDIACHHRCRRLVPWARRDALYFGWGAALSFYSRWG